MDNSPEEYLVARSYTQLQPTDKEFAHCSLAQFRSHAAYVLLGDPGAGKSEAFKREALATGGKYLSARDFCELEQTNQGQVFFIDGLDEMRAGRGDGKTPLGQIRTRLDSLGRPQFRLACRAADWLGASDALALQLVSQDKQIIALQLDPLSLDDVAKILLHKKQVTDSTAFIAQATKLGLADLLKNPQNLHMLLDAIEGETWPDSRQAVYAIACQKLLQEHNQEYPQQPADAQLGQATAYLCAIQLLAGLAGFSFANTEKNSAFARLNEVENPHNLPLTQTLKTKLFKADHQQRCWPIHRSVAEFLGAKFIAEAITKRGLPLTRVLAMIASSDGGIVTDLRGLAAWLAVHCPRARSQLIERDPLGVVLYGDVKDFSIAEKTHILHCMRNEAQRYTGFRAEANSPHQFGALGSRNMLEVFRQKLTSPSRTDADQVLLYCILDAMTYGEAMPELMQELENIFRDASYWSGVRRFSFNTLLNLSSTNTSYWLKILYEIQAGSIPDDDDELLGKLLQEFYPNIITSENILDYLHVAKQSTWFGSYKDFFGQYLIAITPKNDLPSLLDQFVKKNNAITQVLQLDYSTRELLGNLLINGLMEFGDEITDQRLYDWLGIGLDEYQSSRIESDAVQQIRNWLTQRPSKYKAILLQGALRRDTQKPIRPQSHDWTPRLYNATPPNDIAAWYLELATKETGEVAEYYFNEAIFDLKQKEGKSYLTSENLEFIDVWLQQHSQFLPYLEKFTICPLNDWQQKSAIATRKNQAERQEANASWLKHFQVNQIAIRNGSAPVGIFHQLAMLYRGQWQWASGETPDERLKNLFDEDEATLTAVYEGFRQVLTRDDLPSVAEIIGTALANQNYAIAKSCLIGMALRYQDDAQAALEMNDLILTRLVAFSLVEVGSNEPAWLVQLLQACPELVAPVFISYTSKMISIKKSHLNALHKLAHNEIYSKLAPLVLVELLQAFPPRASKDQVSSTLDAMLKAALHFLDSSTLLKLIADKLQLKSLDIPQRIYWLSCGLVLAPNLYEVALLNTIGKSQVKRGYLAQFFHIPVHRQIAELTNLPVATLKLLIETLAVDCEPRNGPERVDFLHNYISALGNDTDVSARLVLEQLLTMPQLASWQQHLRAALHAQRVARRQAEFTPADCSAVSHMLANLAPATPADFVALVADHVREIGRYIRDGNTNDYQQYWHSPKDKEQCQPRSEDECRNALLSDLQLRLARLNFSSHREPSYADEKKADIGVSYRAGQQNWHIPIEAKKSTSSDVWTAIHKQLIPRYMRDPSAHGYGIYLVFWFGADKKIRTYHNAKRPSSAAQMEEWLRALLEPEERSHIHICVIDCALPDKSSS